MKKFKGTKYAHIGTSYNPTLAAEIDRVEQLILNQQARLDELAQELRELET